MTITPAQYSKAQRRLLTTFGGLGVAALAAGTFVLSYDDLRLLALRGGAARHWAFLYPGMLDGLVVVIILAILSARRAGWFSRAVRWLLLILLIAGAGAAGVRRAVKGYAALPDTWVNVGVAVAPWAILIIAVWLWTGIIKQVLGRRSRAQAVEAEPLAEPEPVPATVVDKSIIPGLDAGDTRTLPRPAAPIRELAPVRQTAPPAPAEPEANPWDAARLDPEPEPQRRTDAESSWERADEPTEPNEPVPPSWLDPASDTAPPDAFWGGEADDRTATAPNPVQAEPSDPVPDSWRDPEPDASPGHAEPLLPPAPRRDDLPEEPVRPEADAPAATEPDEPKVEAPMNRDEEPAPRLVARTSLPTDVRLVGGPKPALTDTQPDGIKLPDTMPDGIPIVGTPAASSGEEDEEEEPADERAEDPDAGDGMEATPPSSKFRSGPTPPRG